MRRRKFLRGVTASVVATVAGSTVARRLLARPRVTATQVDVDGVPQPFSDLVVRVGRPLDLLDVDGVAVVVRVLEPATGAVVPRELAVVAVDVTGPTLTLRVDGPLTEGAVLEFDAGSVAIDGIATEAFSLHVEGIGLQSPTSAARWFKAYEPTDRTLFAAGLYGAVSAPVTDDVEERTDPAAVRRRLVAHLERFVDRGWLAEADRAATLDRFDDPVVRGRFAAADGSFDPELLAGVLANAGTVARGVVDVVVDGENRLDRPYLVRRQPTLSGGFMEVRIYDGSPVVYVDPQVAAEPFTVLAPLFAHEGFHQDITVGLEEELVSTYLETLVYAQHLLVAPEIARTNTPKTRRANTMLLLALNSGALGFPNVGLHAAPHRQWGTNAAPLASRSVAGFRGAVETNYRRTGLGESPGSPYLEAVVSGVTGASAAGVRFDRSLLDRLDAGTTLFSSDDCLQLLSTLRLTLASDAATTPLADPVAAADASLDGDAVAADTDIRSDDALDSRDTHAPFGEDVDDAPFAPFTFGCGACSSDAALRG